MTTQKTRTIHTGFFSSEITGTVKVQVLGSVRPWLQEAGPQKLLVRLLVRRFQIHDKTANLGQFTAYDALFLADPEEIKEIKAMEVPE